MNNIEMTKNQKLLAALSYFSILFAPLLFHFAYGYSLINQCQNMVKTH